MRGWSFPAGRLLGVDIRIHVTFLFLLGFVWFSESLTMGVSGPGRGLALVGIIFGCVIVHELAHAVVAKRSGIIVLAAGVLILSFAPQVKLWTQPFVHANNLPRSLFWSNLFLGAFNLLPAYPMDGGRILRALLAERMDYVHATRRAVTIGQVFAMFLMMVGLVWNAWLVLIGFVLFVGAQLEDRSAVFQSVLETVHMEDVMLTQFSILSPADTLEDALSKAVHTLQDDFPVV